MSSFEHNRKQEPRILHWIRSYLSFNLSHSIRLQDMARRAHLSPSQFSVLFKQPFGETPYHYLHRIRIEHVRGLLSNSSIPFNK